MAVPARPEILHLEPFAGAPQLNGARRVGVRPGTELIHPLAATGERPLQFRVDGLPPGISVDADGILRGRAPEGPGEHRLTVTVTNARGSVSDVVRLDVGHMLALTPPMGWNSWNVFAHEVTAEVVVRTAEQMVANGMRDLGYQYVNIDDFWHADRRAPDGRPLANPDTFPDGIAAVADAVHALGLKLGIYSDAGDMTCGRCFGGNGFEEVDARTYADWGVDLLKYDYCFAPARQRVALERYGRMSSALASTSRSIVFSVCEWGFRRPWQWAAQLGGHYWRTTPDIFDTFSRSFLGVRGIARHNLGLADHAGPGHWNDPDMLLVGNRGRGHSTGTLRTPKSARRLWSFRGLDDVQAQSHMTLWAMMAAPLLASHDLTDADPFDTALLTNPHVLAVNQDVLGRQARRVRSASGVWQLLKPLADGGVAVSFTNVGGRTRQVRTDLEGLLGPDGAAGLRVTDAWTGEDLGPRRTISASLPRHGSAMFVVRAQ